MLAPRRARRKARATALFKHASPIALHLIPAESPGGSFWVSRSRPEGGDLAGLAEHLIDVAGM
jgi:hypothetical protein